ncbi:MAG: GDP-mannose 4,6-dehydratase [Opitutaceae bacterium]|nr:GDP-mannose 4,6-dehydratase [Opitutaceae bacterium]
MRAHRTILVTGGAGFVGGHLIEALLDRRYRVICLDLMTYAGSLAHLRPAMDRYPHRIVDRLWSPRATAVPLTIVRGDINDAAMVGGLLAQGDGIIALAAETHVDFSYHTPGTFVRANVNGTHALLEALRHAGAGKRMLHVSTDEVYGERVRGRSTETDPLRPRNIYAATKACGDLLVRAYADVYGLDVVTVRPCNLFGPGQQPKDLIPKTFAYLLAGRKMTVHGDGRHRREYLYVRDAVRQMIAVYERGRSGEAYNLASGVHRSTLQVVRTVARSLGLDPAVAMTFVADRPNPDRRYAGDNRKLRRLLGRRFRLTPFADVIDLMRAEFVRQPPPILP